MGEATWVRTLPDLDGTRVIVCSGELDTATAGPLREALKAAELDGVDKTVVDLASVTFADSSLLNTLVQAHRRQRLVVVGPYHPQLSRLFQVTGTDIFFDPMRD
ncbi:STAS domain-containing protein [Streptomyces sp. NBC_01426]|uniref:STAS domain-containing protein n=1 Tax=unclassified Streptomyces TaxID=2593676 RepID=UPI002E3051D2|nr:STAS domain-containing protein [Streptomyces sp. NBC_01426]